MSRTFTGGVPVFCHLCLSNGTWSSQCCSSCSRSICDDCAIVFSDINDLICVDCYRHQYAKCALPSCATCISTTYDREECFACKHFFCELCREFCTLCHKYYCVKHECVHTK